MAIWVRCVGRMCALMIRPEHEKIRQQIGQGMQPVGNERLRPAKIAHDQLQYGQQQVYRHAYPGAPLCGGKALRIGVLHLLVRHVNIARSVSVIFHVS